MDTSRRRQREDTINMATQTSDRSTQIWWWGNNIRMAGSHSKDQLSETSQLEKSRICKMDQTGIPGPGYYQLWMGKDHQLLDQELQRYILHRELGTALQVRVTFTPQESSWQRVGKKGTSNPAATARLRMKHAPRSSGTAQSCRMQELKGTITSVKCYQRELKRRSG